MAEEIITKTQKDTVFLWVMAGFPNDFLSMAFFILTFKQILDPKNDFVLVLGEEGRSQGLTIILNYFEITSAVLKRRVEYPLQGLTSWPETMSSLSGKW